ncbi:MAG: hypothetical protein DWQ01_10775 [Planctomycetota bacterium]|nr:MAG: hypothetical protein DWQ01_10775 [Planctomycetota bacterium]
MPQPDQAMNSSQFDSAPVLVAAFPFDVRPGEVQQNTQEVLKAVDQAAAAGARLLLLPEKWPTSFLPSFSDQDRQASEEALETVHRRARDLDLHVVGSAPGGGGAKPFNELHLLGPGGPLRPYRKRMLFSPAGEGRQCQAGGEAPELFSLPWAKLFGLICYDLRFPEITRPAFYQEADLMVVPAQWPHPRTEVFELMARARAAENQMWLLACNRSGEASLGRQLMRFPGTAMLVDPLGEIVARRDDGGLLLAEVDFARIGEVRRRVPCARDLKKAGLWPESKQKSGLFSCPKGEAGAVDLE